MDAGVPEPAEVLGNDIRLDAAVRAATHIDVDPSTLACIEQLLDARRPDVAVFFGLDPGDREGASLLRYTAGGRFKPHRDRGDVPSWPDAARRRISLVLFLTSSTAVDPQGTFSGGALRLIDDGGATVREIQPRAGTLVAFPATMLHEVTPVTSGVRDAVVDWFYDPAGDGL